MEVTGKKTELKPDEKHCEPCKEEGKTTLADGICQECEEFICDTCFKHHLKARFCRNHSLVQNYKLVVSRDKGGNEQKCVTHSTETVRFYCRQHHVTGCGDCMLLEHKSCAPEYIKDIAKTFPGSNEYKKFQEILLDSNCKLEVCLSKVEKCTSTINDWQRNSIKEINEFRQEINSFLDNAEEVIKQKVKEYETKNTDRLSKCRSELLTLKASLEDAKTKVESSDGFDLFMATTQHKELPEKIRAKVSEIDVETELGEVKFVPSLELRNVVKQAGCLGSIQGIKKDNKTYVHTSNRFKLDQTGKAKNGGKLHSKELQAGDRVRRGPDWKWDDEDNGGPGTVIIKYSPGWYKVKWDNGYTDNYRMGAENSYDLQFVAE